MKLISNSAQSTWRKIWHQGDHCVAVWEAAGQQATTTVARLRPAESTLVTGAASERPQNPKPTVSATPATPRPTLGPGSLCREYFEYAEHPWQGDEAAWIALHGQLSKLAGGSSPVKISAYCLRHLDNPFDGKGGRVPAGAPVGGPGTTGRADTGSASLGAGSQGNQPSATSDQGQSAEPGAGVSPP